MWLEINGQFNQAIKIIKERLELNANDLFGLAALGHNLMGKGVYEETNIKFSQVKQISFLAGLSSPLFREIMKPPVHS